MKTLSTLTTTKGTGDEMKQLVGAKPETLDPLVLEEIPGEPPYCFGLPAPTAGHKQMNN